MYLQSMQYTHVPCLKFIILPSSKIEFIFSALAALENLCVLFIFLLYAKNKRKAQQFSFICL